MHVTQVEGEPCKYVLGVLPILNIHFYHGEIQKDKQIRRFMRFMQEAKANLFCNRNFLQQKLCWYH